MGRPQEAGRVRGGTVTRALRQGVLTLRQGRRQKTCTWARDAKEERRGDDLSPVQGMHDPTCSRPLARARVRRVKQIRGSAGREGWMRALDPESERHST